MTTEPNEPPQSPPTLMSDIVRLAQLLTDPDARLRAPPTPIHGRFALTRSGVFGIVVGVNSEGSFLLACGPVTTSYWISDCIWARDRLTPVSEELEISAITKLTELTTKLSDARENLALAQRTFRSYAAIHQAKVPPDDSKAAANHDLAEQMASCLRRISDD